MTKKYKNRVVSTSESDRMMSDDSVKNFFFPKANPPVSISAKSQEEAESKLKTFTGNKE